MMTTVADDCVLRVNSRPMAPILTVFRVHLGRSVQVDVQAQNCAPSELHVPLLVPSQTQIALHVQVGASQILQGRRPAKCAHLGLPAHLQVPALCYARQERTRPLVAQPAHPALLARTRIYRGKVLACHAQLGMTVRRSLVRLRAQVERFRWMVKQTVPHVLQVKPACPRHPPRPVRLELTHWAILVGVLSAQPAIRVQR